MREILEEHVKMPIAEAARRMKISRPALYNVLNGTAAVTAEMALRFARLTSGAPELYLSMQVGHDLEVAQRRLQHELADIEPAPQHRSATISTGNKTDYFPETTGRAVLRRTPKPRADPPRDRRPFGNPAATIIFLGITAPPNSALIARSAPAAPTSAVAAVRHA